MIKSFLKICVPAVLLLFFAGCDTYKTYSEQSPSCFIIETSVWGNMLMGHRGNHRMVRLKKEKLEEYLLSIVRTEIDYKPLYIPEDVKLLIPDIQNSLAECGNVEVARASFAPYSVVRHWIIGNMIYGEAGGTGLDGGYTNYKHMSFDIPPKKISEDWIEKAKD